MDAYKKSCAIFCINSRKIPKNGCVPRGGPYPHRPCCSNDIAPQIVEGLGAGS